VVTDHRMIFRVSPQQTTLYDEIEYQGSPSSFAWVLPIQGKVSVGVSSDVVFGSLEANTATTIFGPQLNCPSANGGSFGGGSSSGGSSSGGSGGGVNVIDQSTVGPYDAVQLQSSDPNALNAWLGANGYAIPQDVQPIIAAYVNEGFDFLAVKLMPGQSVSAMRPISVTTPGAGLSLPLRMVSAGTGATVGITLWVIADGRYEPQNFPTFVISGSDLTWDYATEQSNYTTVRAQKEQALAYAGWQIESSMDMPPYQIEALILARQADQDYDAVPAGDGGADAGVGETADQARQADLALLFPDQNMVRITRMRGDIAHAALANDLVLYAPVDQSVKSSFYQVTQSINTPPCPGSSSGSGGGSGGGNGSSGSNGGKESFGCSTATTDADGSPWAELVMGGFLGFALIRKSVRRRGR
jgi:MYXO-CTERM domain-containing protein